MASDKIIIKGAREHNLKDVNLEIPRNKMIVFTGLSGSGKSSLAFDTIFAEGQRRYIESLSAYARQFLGKLDKPDVDEIEGLSPAISIDQKSHSANPRSTVATITEIYDYLRVLFARAGTPYCPICGKEIRRLTQEEIVDAIISLASQDEGGQLTILAPIIRGRKGEHYQMLYNFLNIGFSEVRIDGKFQSLRQRILLDRNKRHTIELIVDRIPAGFDFKDKDNRLRLAEAVEHALQHGGDVLTVLTDKGDTHFSALFGCPDDGYSFPEIEPRLFSFNSPYGACKACSGLGIEELHSEKLCPECEGKRLNDAALSVLIENKNIAQIASLSIGKAIQFMRSLPSSPVVEVPLREIVSRLQFMLDVGLDYLTLERRAGTLSGGEAQRIRLASQIGSRLVGALYVLDEPTIGLHQRDNAKLLSTLKTLRDLGNTIIVVEHDEETIHTADYLVDIGPGAGVHGGEIVVAGEMSSLLKNKNAKSLTLDYLRGDESVPIPEKRRKVKKLRRKGGQAGDFISVIGATAHNLKNINADIPCRKLTCITGVSGSGKSTLVYDILYKTIANKFNSTSYKEGKHNSIKGLKYINRIINIDQSSIGRTPRSNPATYVGAWTHIRELFSQTEDARVRGYRPGRFSFNTPGGRCENCEGHGRIAIEMHFLPTVFVECDICKGRRFDRETLEVKYNEKNIHDILEMTIEEGLAFFRDIPWIHDKFKIMNEVGLGYLTIGQPAPMLSGGEAQRVKLSAELGKRDTRKTLYLLDEPTTGLHFEDVRKLLEVLDRLVERGNTVVVIEHNLDVIKTADWVIDLGPEGGDKGGKIVAQGTPEDVAAKKDSYTGQYLKKVLA